MTMGNQGFSIIPPGVPMLLVRVAICVLPTPPGERVDVVPLYDFPFMPMTGDHIALPVMDRDGTTFTIDGPVEGRTLVYEMDTPGGPYHGKPWCLTLVVHSLLYPIDDEEREEDS